MWARIVGSSVAINYDTRAICPRLAMESGTGGKSQKPAPPQDTTSMQDYSASMRKQKLYMTTGTQVSCFQHFSDSLTFQPCFAMTI